MVAVDEFDRGTSHLPTGDAESPPPVAAPSHSPAVEEDSLSDDDLRSEIELVADLVVAASTTDQALSQPEIDRVLGVEAAGG
jgi:hypothetical protein